MTGVIVSGKTEIPVRNLWLLMLYASELYANNPEIRGGGAEDRPDELPDLVAEVLARAVERRLQRSLSRAYVTRSQPLTRVRGRIDVIKTESAQLLSRGQVACRYDEHVVDNPTNRLICAGLISLALVHACTTMNLSERRSEVACMLVQGVRQHYLFQLLLSEALYLWLIGLALGVPLGFAAGEWLLSHYQSDLIDMRLELRPGTVIGTGLASLLVTLLASWRAIWSLLQTPLAEATRSPD